MWLTQVLCQPIGVDLGMNPRSAYDESYSTRHPDRPYEKPPSSSLYINTSDSTVRSQVRILSLDESIREDIRDRNKVGRVLRIFTVFQIVWFVVDMAGRRAQNLAIVAN